MRIEGMSCGSCVSRVRQAILSTHGTKAAEVSLTGETAVVQVERDTTFETLADCVRLLGYEASEIKDQQGADPAIEEREFAKRLRIGRQAVITALMYGLPVMGLEFLGPTLASTIPGGDVWWRVLQGGLCLMLLYSPAGGPMTSCRRKLCTSTASATW